MRERTNEHKHIIVKLGSLSKNNKVAFFANERIAHHERRKKYSYYTQHFPHTCNYGDIIGVTSRATLILHILIFANVTYTANETYGSTPHNNKLDCITI